MSLATQLSAVESKPKAETIRIVCPEPIELDGKPYKFTCGLARTFYFCDADEEVRDGFTRFALYELERVILSVNQTTRTIDADEYESEAELLAEWERIKGDAAIVP